MAVISIKNMQFYAHHGCYATEQKVGTHFSVDLSFSYDSSAAESSDDILRAVNYLEVYGVVKEQMNIPSHLLENVAVRIKRAVEDGFPQARDVKVSVSKLNPPLGGKLDRVTVEL